MAIDFPNINPVIISIGPLAIRWYSLAYITGLLAGWHILKNMINSGRLAITIKHLDDLLMWMVLGVVVGGRFGYVLFYQSSYYADNPLEALALWHGGMSFHGGMLGAIAAVYICCRRNKLAFWPVMDAAALVAPIGLGLGRIANFINGELYGRATDVPWAMIFPGSDGLPRHPSQLYQAGMEGVMLGMLLWLIFRRRPAPSVVSACFLIFYAILRASGEFFREPDAYLGYFAGGITMGQLLCLPMLMLGIFLLIRQKNAAV